MHSAAVVARSESLGCQDHSTMIMMMIAVLVLVAGSES